MFLSNDLTSITPGKNILFADDAVFYITERSLSSCIEKVIFLLDELSKWMENNKLTINTDKTKLMLFTPHKIDILPEISLNGNKLEWVNSIEYLGIVLDDKLSFVPQSKEVIRALSKLHGIFYAMKNLLPQNILLIIYNSLVASAVTQHIIIWGGIAAVHVNKIEVLMNKILRCILDVRFEDYLPLIHTTDMYKTLNILKYHDIYELNLLKFIHSISYFNHDFFFRYYYPLLPSHNYETRGVRISLPSTRLDIEKQLHCFNHVNCTMRYLRNSLNLTQGDC